MSAFGSVLIPEVVSVVFENNRWSDACIVPSDNVKFHLGAHVFHYSSTCFEGLKAFRHEDGGVYVFRMDQNLERLSQSSRLLSLPKVNKEQVSRMIAAIVAKYSADVPVPPGSMYIRPTHIGTEAAIGKAAAPSSTSMLYVLLSPVGDYFSGGSRALRVLVDETNQRCAPHMGMVKSGGNYASAIYPTLEAKEKYQADQVLFCPSGYITETGAANFILVDGDEVITKSLDSSLLHGVTRSSILIIAKSLGMTVSERDISVDELLERAAKPKAEAMLSGTAAVLTSVGTLIHNGKDRKVGTGEVGPVVRRLRQTLNDIQWGRTSDRYNWLTKIA